MNGIKKWNEIRMTFLEVRDSTLPSSSVTHPSQPPRLNTETPNASLYPSPASHSPPPLSPIQVGTLSVSPITHRQPQQRRPYQWANSPHTTAPGQHSLLRLLQPSSSSNQHTTVPTDPQLFPAPRKHSILLHAETFKHWHIRPLPRPPPDPTARSATSRN